MKQKLPAVSDILSPQRHAAMPHKEDLEMTFARIHRAENTRLRVKKVRNLTLIDYI
jgi:hypothetical protein